MAVGPKSQIIVSTGSQVLDLSGAWRGATVRQGGVVYLLRDSATGQVLKVGQTTSESFIGRFEKYVTGGNRTGLSLEVELFEVPSAQRELRKGRFAGTSAPSLEVCRGATRLGGLVALVAVHRKAIFQGQQYEC